MWWIKLNHKKKNFVYLVGLHIYYKMLHGPYNINSNIYYSLRSNADRVPIRKTVWCVCTHPCELRQNFHPETSGTTHALTQRCNLEDRIPQPFSSAVAEAYLELCTWNECPDTDPCRQFMYEFRIAQFGLQNRSSNPTEGQTADNADRDLVKYVTKNIIRIPS